MYDVIVIGAGAAGLMAAATAARNGKQVLLMEKMEKAGRKIRISGKGRCNVTNARPPEEFKESIRTNADFFEVAFAEGQDLYITLDTATGTLGRKQTEWFRSFIEKNRSRYRHCVILTHTNFFYTDNSQTTSGNMPIEEFFSLIDFLGEHDVSLVLQGHDHYREELVYENVNYTVVGAIADKCKSPEYLKIEVTPEKLIFEWHQISD